MLKQELLYDNLNNLSNNEFEEIVKAKAPVEEFLNIEIQKRVRHYKSKSDENCFEIKDKDDNDREVFFKYITLVDSLRYLTGKYKNEDLTILPGVEEKNANSKYQKYIHDKNNYAYVDSLFYYISGILKTDKQFFHGIECYDMFICQKKNCKINVSDDLEYLCESNFFTQNLGKKFLFEDNEANDIFQQNKKETLLIEETNDLDLEFESIVEETPVDSSGVSHSLTSVNEFLIDDLENDDGLALKYQYDTNDTLTNNDEDSDEDSEEYSEEEDSEEEDSEEYSKEEDSEEEDSEDSEEYSEEEDSEEEDSQEDSEEDSEEEDKIYLLLNKFPTQVVVIEKCTNTLDELLDGGEIKMEEIESAIFQIITTLYVYQKKYNFTHNDLHTNNIMYCETDKEYLIYKIKDKIYKIPTYGKIYKIIDFGRAIYDYNGHSLCSDSFSRNGTAHTQYNYNPYYNEKKPLVEPNMSFDLCRLACSIFDFVCDDINNIDEYRNIAPIYDLIFSWLYDDNGENVLYKQNGDDKYPGFKLYKMISRIVHKHIPEDQYEHNVLKKYIASDLIVDNCLHDDKCHYMDIDDIIS